MDNQNYNHDMNFMSSAQPTTRNIDSMDKTLAAEATMNDHAQSLTATSPSFSDMSISNTNLGKEKRPPRMRFSQEASDRLYSLYKAGISKPNKQLREELAKELGTTPRSIQIWFQNRRAKAKHIFAQHGQEISDEEEFAGLYNRKNLSLNMNSLPSSHSSSPKSAHNPYYSSPYSSSYVNHLQSRPSPGQRRISVDNIISSPYSSVQRRHSSQFFPQQMRSTSLGGIYQRSPQGPLQSPISQLLGYDSPSFGDLMKNDYSLTKEQSAAYPSPQEMQYGRSLKSFSSNGSGKIDASPQSGSFPPSATELIRSSPTSALTGSSFCQEPQSDSPYHTGFTFENISSSETFHESTSKSKFAVTLPDLQEITSDPSKFINWLNNSN